MASMTDQLNNQTTRQSVLLNNARRTHLNLHQEIHELSEELRALYERESRLLKMLDKRDKQLAQTPDGRHPKVAPAATAQKGNPDSEKAMRELELLQKRYLALSRSKLGRLQLWYWRIKSGR